MRLSDSIVELQPMTTGLKQVVVPKRPQSYSLDSLVESISYVCLETRSECLLGDIDKIIATPAVLFILDKRNSSVLRFDKMGKFLGRIGGQGRGPGEYQSVYDIAVTSDYVCVLDLDGGKQIYYTHQGELCEEVPLYYYYTQMEFMMNGRQAQHTSFSYNENAPALDKHRLILVDEKQRPMAVASPYSENLRVHFHWTSPLPLSSFQGRVFFHQALSDTIWEVSDRSLMARYVINCPESPMRNSLQADDVTDEIWENMAQNRTYFQGKYVQSPHIICFYISDKGRISPLYYNKDTGAIRYGYGYSENNQHSLLKQLSLYLFDYSDDSSDGDTFIKVIQPFEMLRTLKLLGDPLNVEDEHFVKNTDMEDNPILAFIKLRSQSIR
jgi:hypothetical protein